MKPRRLDYRMVWRWHFYAGLFCIPFVVWLAMTGSIYLFKPQIENWLDRPYSHLALTGQRATPRAQVVAALAAVPGSTLNSYQLPASSQSAVQVLVGRGSELFRAYVQPETLAVLKLEREDRRPMVLLFYLHGELLMGDRGSMIVELAASWAMVMILTGLFLWWPRKRGLGGIVYPRLTRGNRVFWRDLHAVAGVWVSCYTLFLLTSGLPWATSWSKFLKGARRLGGETVARLDWTTGRSSELSERIAMNTPAPLNPEDHDHHLAGGHSAGRPDYASLDRVVATVAPLELAPPVKISPPSKASPLGWAARSDAPNRLLRTSLVLDGTTGAIISRQDFGQGPLIDRLVGIGVSAHEGQLFGIANQLLGLFTAAGLITVSVSAAVMWWQRRPAGVLGVLPARPNSRIPAVVFALVTMCGVALPMLGLSLLAVLGLERTVFRRVPAVREFLGLSPA